MAWLGEINWKCRECNRKPATVEMFGLRNESFGKFCKSCGEKRLKAQKKFEDESRLPKSAEVKA